MKSTIWGTVAECVAGAPDISVSDCEAGVHVPLGPCHSGGVGDRRRLVLHAVSASLVSFVVQTSAIQRSACGRHSALHRPYVAGAPLHGSPKSGKGSTALTIQIDGLGSLR